MFAPLRFIWNATRGHRLAPSTASSPDAGGETVDAVVGLSGEAVEVELPPTVMLLHPTTFMKVVGTWALNWTFEASLMPVLVTVEVTDKAPVDPSVPDTSVRLDWPLLVTTPAVTPMLAALMAAARPASFPAART